MAEEFAEKQEQILNEGPPLEWFVAIGRKDGGIKQVAYSEELTEKDGGKVGKRLDEWRHFTRSPSAGRSKIGQKKIVEDEKYISEATGFSPKEISDKGAQLTKMYRGKKEAPFKVELY